MARGRPALRWRRRRKGPASIHFFDAVAGVSGDHADGALILDVFVNELGSDHVFDDLILPYSQARFLVGHPGQGPLNVLGHQGGAPERVVDLDDLHVHPAAGHQGGTLVNALLHYCRDLSGIGGVLRPGIVHRLDKETSGLLVVAKSDEAHRGLAGQFKRHEVAKTYQAIVYGDPKTEGGRIEAPVGRHPTDRKKMSTKSRRGKGAVTVWRVRERFGVASLLDVDIETGRTHQIRVHLMELGYPVVGDKAYGGAGRIRTIEDSAVRAGIKALQRQALHAWRLSFAHPVTGEKMRFPSPLPEDMAALCAFLRERVSRGGDKR